MRGVCLPLCFGYHLTLEEKMTNKGASVRYLRLIMFMAMTGIVSGCSTQAPAPVPSYVTATNTCSVLLGGGGPVHEGDEKANTFWFTVSGNTSKHLADDLSMIGYKIEPDIVDIRTNEGRLAELARKIAATHCNKTI